MLGEVNGPDAQAATLTRGGCSQRRTGYRSMRDSSVMLRTIRLLGLSCVALVALAVLGAYALLASYVYLAPSLPTVDAMRAGVLAVPLRVYARGGELIGEIGEKRRLPVGL